MADAKASGRTVTIACNIPNGMTLRVCAPQTQSEPVLGGGMRDVTVFRETARVTVKGPARPKLHDDSFEYPVLDKNGFALTQVSADLWEAWLRDNQTSLAVVNGCIYAVAEPDKAGDKAHRGIKSGLEPVSSQEDPRMPKRRPNLSPGQGTRAA